MLGILGIWGKPGMPFGNGVGMPRLGGSLAMTKRRARLILAMAYHAYPKSEICFFMYPKSSNDFFDSPCVSIMSSTRKVRCHAM